MNTKYFFTILFFLKLENFLIFSTEEEIFDENPLITHYEDENEMRKRLKEITDEKFSHAYHFHKNVSKNNFFDKFEKENFEKTNTLKKIAANFTNKKIISRRKRDGGLTMAVLSGVIGVTAKAVADITSYNPSVSEGGCSWFGTSPLCNHYCPSEYDFIRYHNGRCSSRWFSGFCRPDDSFGEPCTNLLFGAIFKKRFCCKSDPRECTWAGRWMGANTAFNAYCRYDNSAGRCGELSCSINHYDWKATDRTEIRGERCDELNLFNLTGHATCGYIAWFDSQNDLVNSWYKTSS